MRGKCSTFFSVGLCLVGVCLLMRLAAFINQFLETRRDNNLIVDDFKHKRQLRHEPLFGELTQLSESRLCETTSRLECPNYLTIFVGLYGRMSGP